MGIFRKAIFGATLLLAVGSAVIVADADPIRTKLVPESLADEGNLLVEVEAERINIYNSPHDGLGHVGGLVGPILPSVAVESPPDLMLCVIKTATTACQANGGPSDATSYCHDSFRCKWRIDVTAKETFALVVFDLDLVAGRSVSDLVDAVIVPGSDPAAASVSAALETKARALIEDIAPTTIGSGRSHPGIGPILWRPGEARRRARSFVEAPVPICAERCELEQSALTMGWITG